MRKVKKDFLVDEVTDDPEREVYAKENITLCVPPRSLEADDAANCMTLA